MLCLFADHHWRLRSRGLPESASVSDDQQNDVSLAHSSFPVPEDLPRERFHLGVPASVPFHVIFQLLRSVSSACVDHRIRSIFSCEWNTCIPCWIAPVVLLVVQGSLICHDSSTLVFFPPQAVCSALIRTSLAPFVQDPGSLSSCFRSCWGLGHPGESCYPSGS